MTLQDVKTMIKEMADEIDCQYSYYSFEMEEGETKPPFLVFYYPDNNDLYADDMNFCKIKGLTIEFYTDYKDFENEAIIERILEEHEIAYDSESTYISGEHLFEQIYTMEVLING